MEFAWTAEQQAYRAKVRGFLQREMPDNWFTDIAKGRGSVEQVEFSREFCPKLAKAGLLTAHWPKEYGGADATPWEHFILAEELWTWAEPRGPQYMNVNWIGPALMRYGTPEQKAQHLGAISRGEVIWCQGFSEPQAGTDLAALQTRAERRGDVYVINGQKIWTSYAHLADWCFLLARTAPDRKAISVFLVPMDSPGIRVAPFEGLPEAGHLNEVFFTDVEVPAANRVGEEGRAWEIVTYALSHERVGIPRYDIGRKVIDTAIDQLKREGRFDAAAAAAAARIVAKLEAFRMLTYLVVDQRAKQTPPTVDANIARISGADAIIDVMDYLMKYVPDCLTGGDKYLEIFFRANTANTITSGAYEIQLNLISQGALNLPREG